MEDTFLEAFCYHFALDYDNFRNFFHNWFTIRGIIKHIDLNIPDTPRIYISVPLVKDNGILIRSSSVDSVLSPSSVDEIDVLYEGSLCSDASSSCHGDNSPILTANDGNGIITPDIVRTIARNYHDKKILKSDSLKSLLDNETDPGFQSDASIVGVDTFKKLEELQEQFSKMQKDIANLVHLHSLHESNKTLESLSSFTPIMSSSPAIKTRSICAASLAPPPPPPCLPPPPPPTPSHPLAWKVGITKKLNKHSSKDGMPDMTEILKGISSVKLRPVKRINIADETPETTENRSISFVHRVPLRPVSRHESLIASALRERFQHFRMVINSNESSSAEISDDWQEDDEKCLDGSITGGKSNNSINAGRALLRKVDRSILPQTVSKDFMNDD